MRNPLAPIIATCILALAGCGNRDVPPMRVTITPDGPNIYVTRETFYIACPQARRIERAAERRMGDYAMARVNGLYDPRNRVCWAVCDDPANPDREAEGRMLHEIAHRVDHLYGEDVGTLWWHVVPRHQLTHRHINHRLAQWEKHHGL